jgi:hypothetical protein
MLFLLPASARSDQSSRLSSHSITFQTNPTFALAVPSQDLSDFIKPSSKHPLRLQQSPVKLSFCFVCASPAGDGAQPSITSQAHSSPRPRAFHQEDRIHQTLSRVATTTRPTCPFSLSSHLARVNSCLPTPGNSWLSSPSPSPILPRLFPALVSFHSSRIPTSSFYRSTPVALAHGQRNIPVLA